MLVKAYKFQLFPTEQQIIAFENHFGTARFIYNWGLAKKIEHYTVAKKALSYFQLVTELPKLKKEKPWLKDINSQSLQCSLRNLDNAFTAFFRKQNDFPKFKAKHFSKPSFQCPQSVKLDVDKQLISLPKIPDISIALHRAVEGKIKTSTISKTPTGKYFISLTVEQQGELPTKQAITEQSILGIDMGLKDFITTSNGEKIAHPKFLQQSQQRLAIHQRRFSKKKKGSKNREKQKLKVALIHEKIANQRKDFLHKLTRKLVNDSQVTAFGLEDLNISGMVKNHKLAKAIGSSGWRMFKTFLSYKSDETGKTIIDIPRFAPSSKLCNVCGKINKNLKLNERVWKCSCGSVNDRDFNAAKNIKVFSWLQLHRPSGTADDVKQSFSEGLGVLQLATIVRDKLPSLMKKRSLLSLSQW